MMYRQYIINTSLLIQLRALTLGTLLVLPLLLMLLLTAHLMVTKLPILRHSLMAIYSCVDNALLLTPLGQFTVGCIDRVSRPGEPRYNVVRSG